MNNTTPTKIKMEKKYQLPREFGEKWVAALRGGEYKQANGKLYDKRENSYCCLGVACSLANISKSFLIQNETNLLANPNFTDKRGLPFQIRNVDFNRTVAEMNDTGKPFHEIADWIEENVEFI